MLSSNNVLWVFPPKNYVYGTWRGEIFNSHLSLNIQIFSKVDRKGSRAYLGNTGKQAGEIPTVQINLHSLHPK